MCFVQTCEMSKVNYNKMKLYNLRSTSENTAMSTERSQCCALAVETAWSGVECATQGSGVRDAREWSAWLKRVECVTQGSGVRDVKEWSTWLTGLECATQGSGVCDSMEWSVWLKGVECVTQGSGERDSRNNSMSGVRISRNNSVCLSAQTRSWLCCTGAFSTTATGHARSYHSNGPLLAHNMYSQLQ